MRTESEIFAVMYHTEHGCKCWERSSLSSNCPESGCYQGSHEDETPTS